jgi:hypothetical protein
MLLLGGLFIIRGEGGIPGWLWALAWVFAVLDAPGAINRLADRLAWFYALLT